MGVNIVGDSILLAGFGERRRVEVGISFSFYAICVRLDEKRNLGKSVVQEQLFFLVSELLIPAHGVFYDFHRSFGFFPLSDFCPFVGFKPLVGFKEFLYFD